MVSEIIDNALDVVEELEAKSVKNVGDILENLSNKFQELAISEEKSKISEIMEGSHASTFGVGDHIDANKEVSTPPGIRQPPVEKKSRLTDLVKNSKHLWAKLMLNEHKDETRDSKSEKILRVVDLDCKEQPFKAVKSEQLPEDLPLPRSDSEDILNSPDENNSLDEINLSSSHGDEIKKTMTFPLAGSSGKSLMECYRTIKLTADLKKKKWNIGTKIVNYIRKQQAKRQGKGVSEGIEITPQADQS